MYKSNSIIVSFVVVVLFFLGSHESSKSQCPPGYTQQHVLVEVGDGCIFSAEVCFKCSPLGGGATEVILITNPVLESPGCIPSVAYEDVLDEFLAVIQSPNYIYNNLCPTTNIPPCDNNGSSETLTVTLPQCWQAEVIMYYGEKHITYKTCSDDVCKVTWEVCKNQFGVYEKTIVGTPIGGIPECTLEAWEITNFPDAWDLSNYPLNVPTDCFISHTPCNP